MSLSQPITWPFYEGATVSAEVPWKFPVALAGWPFMLDLETAPLERQTIPFMRSQQDTSDEPGGQSLNPQGLWRRTQDDWSHGAGQTHYDRPTSDRARFRSPKGVNVWTPHELSLLFDTTQKRASVNTNLALLPVGVYTYAADGNEVYSTTTDLAAAASRDVHDGETPQSVKSITTNGSTVYAALGSNGIHSGAAGSDFAHYSDLSATLVGWVKGRLMAANGAAIYNVVASGAAPSALFTHPNSGWTWIGFADGPGFVYMAGYAGDLSSVYRTAIKADGTALDTPVHAGSLLPGETIRSIRGYLGVYLLVGTDKGWRMLTLNDSGDVSGMSDLIPTSSAVMCFEAQDHFIWYGLSNPDSMSTGLGRADPGVFTKGINPAYASDLMATGQGAVLSAITFNNKRIFAVSGLGFYQEATTRVPQGTLDTGLMRMGIPNDKISMFVDVRHEPLAGTVAMYLAANRGSFDRVGIHSTAGDIGGTAMPTDRRRGDVLELRAELNRSGSDTTAGPTVTQHTFMANPAVDSGEFIIAPLMIATSYQLDTETDAPRDPPAEVALIKGLRSQRTVTTWQEGSDVETVTVEDYDWRGYKLIPWNDRLVTVGTCLVKMKTIPEAA